MVTPFRTIAPLGDVIAAIFDEAATYTSNQAEVSHLAAMAMQSLLRRTRETRRKEKPCETPLGY